MVKENKTGVSNLVLESFDSVDRSPWSIYILYHGFEHMLKMGRSGTLGVQSG